MNTVTSDRLMVVQGRIPAEIQQRLVGVYPNELAANHWLCEDVWWKLYQKAIPGIRAENLAHRVLTADQIDHILAKENRSRPYLAMLAYNELDPARQALILDNERLGSSVAGNLPRYEFFDEALFEKASTRMHGMFRLASIMERMDAMSDTAVAEELGAIDSWWGSDRNVADRTVALGALFALRPGVLAELVSPNMPYAFRQPMAGCRHLREQSWQYAVLGVACTEAGRTVVSEPWDSLCTAVVWNPYATEEVIEYVANHGGVDAQAAAAKRLASKRCTLQHPFEEVRDPDQLGWLMTRCCSRKFERELTHKYPRPADLCALAHNPALNEHQRKRIAEDLRAISAPGPYASEVFVPKRIVVEAFEALGAPFEHDARRVEASDYGNLRRRYQPGSSHHRTELAAYAQRMENLVLDEVTTARIEAYRVEDFHPYMSGDAVGETVALLAHQLEAEQFVLMLQMAARHKGTVRQLRETVQRLTTVR